MSPKQAPGDGGVAATVWIYAHLSIFPLDSDAGGPFEEIFLG